MSESKDPPIVSPGYLHGVTVVDLGDFRVSRGRSRRPYSSCGHKDFLYDDLERRIWCKDCETTLELFDVLMITLSGFDRATKRLNVREEKIIEAEKLNIRSLAAKEIDKAWRMRNQVPICPNCRSGLLAEDFKHGCATMSKEFAITMRKKKKD